MKNNIILGWSLKFGHARQRESNGDVYIGSCERHVLVCVELRIGLVRSRAAMNMEYTTSIIKHPLKIKIKIKIGNTILTRKPYYSMA